MPLAEYLGMSSGVIDPVVFSVKIAGNQGHRPLIVASIRRYRNLWWAILTQTAGGFGWQAAQCRGGPPRKFAREKTRDRIGGAVAAAMAVGRILAGEEGPRVYKTSAARGGYRSCVPPQGIGSDGV